MRLIGNVIWLLLGGIELALGYFLAGVVMCLLIVTIPAGLQAFKLAGFALWPFGRTLVRKPEAGVPSFLVNALWLLLAGWWLALGHFLAALICAITIIGIPFAIAHGKLAMTALAPFGKEVVPIDETSTGIVVSTR